MLKYQVQSEDTTHVHHPSLSAAAVVGVHVSVTVPVSSVATRSVQVPAFVLSHPPTPVAAPAPTPTSAPAITPPGGPRPLTFLSVSKFRLIFCV